MVEEAAKEFSLEEKVALLQKRIDELEATCQKLIQSSDSEIVTTKNNQETVVAGEIKEGNDKKPTETKTEAPTTSSTKPKSRIRVLVTKIDSEGDRKEIDEDAEIDAEASQPGSEYALVLHKFQDDGDKNSRIEIHSPDLRNLLESILKGNPYHTFGGDAVTLLSPFEDLVLKWDILWQEAKKSCKDEAEQRARTDLFSLLQNLVKGSGDPKLDTFLQHRDTSTKQKSVTFDNLWTIFPPGTIVYGRMFLERDQIFLVEDNFRPWPREDMSRRGRVGPKRWQLKCWIYDWHGGSFSRRSVTLTFEEFEGAKPISSLPYHPLEANSDQKNIASRLLERGKIFRSYCTIPPGESLYSYNGQAILDKAGFQGVAVEEADDPFVIGRRDTYTPPKEVSIKSDVMVDFESYYRYGPGLGQVGFNRIESTSTECNCTNCINNEEIAEMYKRKFDKVSGKEEEKWDDLQYMLCPPRVLGYVLKEKQWAQLDVFRLIPLPPSTPEDVFSRLHLQDGDETKDLLFGLVKNHGKVNTGDGGYQITDIVPDKGQGLIVLLYGTPGVGKTSTAQTVAMAVRKPLFSISVADVGTKAKDVESNLRTIFELATTWRAILLIDEADVFMQSRSTRTGPSAERSALVSVFLRVLEYYQGILFLTTNQIAQFDIAVQSRIHIAIKYSELSREQTINIFEEFVGQYHKKRMVDEYKEIQNYAKNTLWKSGFDGRQIRNIVTIAMGYARANNENLKKEHITHVASITEDFKRELAYLMMDYNKENKMKI